MRFSAFAFAFLLAASLRSRDARAIQPLSDFVERAAQQSFDARESRATSAQREAESDAALGGLLPVFSARGVYTRNQYEAAFDGPNGRVVIVPYNQLDAYLQLDVPLVDLARYHRYKSQRALAQAAREQTDATNLDVGGAVARSYYQFVGASALARSAAISVKAAEDNLRVVEQRVAAGVANDLDRERALANVARTQQQLADAELGVALAARGLETLSGLSPTPAQEFQSDDLHEEAPLQRWEALASQTPQRRAAESAQRAAEQSQKAASRALLPTLTASAQERFTNATGFAGREAVYALQLIAAVRLDYTTVATARAQAAAAELQRVRVERTSRAVLDATFEAHRRVQSNIVKSRAARVQASSADRAAKLASQRYEAGVATQLDVTEAQRDAFEADAARIQADADLALARAQLRLSVGKPATSGALP